MHDAPGWGIRVATDAGAGGGHLARTLALAKALAATGNERVIFFTDPGDPRPEPVDAAGFACRPEASTQAVDVAESAGAAGEVRAVVCDSYAVPDPAIARLRRVVPVGVFRDGDARGGEHFTIDTNPGATGGADVLAGPAYAALDPSFAAARPPRRTHRLPGRDGSAVSVLVAFGRIDSADMAAATIEAIQASPLDVALMAATSSRSPTRARLSELAADHAAIRIVFDAPDMAALYAAADVAIGAPGASQFERACCGLPTILLAQNDRQRPLAAAWAESGAATFAAHPNEVPERLARLTDNQACWADMSERASALVDGRGAARLAAALRERVALQAA